MVLITSKDSAVTMSDVIEKAVESGESTKEANTDPSMGVARITSAFSSNTKNSLTR